MLSYAITNRTLFPSSPASSAQPFSALAARCAQLAAEGLDYLLVREKDLPAAGLTTLCRAILTAVRAANPETRVLITSRADIALATHLDGVHLTSNPAELTPTQIRTLYRNAQAPRPAISVSCHTPKEILTTRPEHPDLILFAPVFGKTLQGRIIAPAAGLEALTEACCLAAPIPVLALGGITAERTQQCLQAGAAGIAAIRLFMTPARSS